MPFLVAMQLAFAAACRGCRRCYDGCRIRRAAADAALLLLLLLLYVGKVVVYN